MAALTLRGIWHKYDALPQSGRRPSVAPWVLEDLNLAWEDGLAAALLGPSGCGKTTILNLLSGILHPTRGAVLCGGKDITGLPPRQRSIAQVFQFPVVYEDMTVEGNLMFPLRNQGVKVKEARRRAEEIGALLDLSALMKTPAGRISQAEKQKVSLGRGVVRRDTAAILLDEPLTAIDPKEKYPLRRQLKRVQQELKITMIYVTHDQHEALTFAESVTVMEGGRVVQVGTPEDLHLRPATPFVGFFIGSPGLNLWPAALDGQALLLGSHRLPLSPALAARLQASGQGLQAGIRPEFVNLQEQPHPRGLALRVEGIEEAGTHLLVALQGGGISVRCRARPDAAPAPGASAWAVLPEERLLLYRDGMRIV